MNFNRFFSMCHKLIKTSYSVKKKKQFYSQGLMYAKNFNSRNRRDKHPPLMPKLYDSNVVFGLQIRNFWMSKVVRNEEKDVSAPTFPESVAEGDIRYHKKVGDTVAIDEVVCDIETDKTVIPVISPANGVIVELYAQDMSTVKSAQKLFKIRIGPGGAPSGQQPKTKDPPRPKTPEPQIKPVEHKLPSPELPPAQAKPPVSQKKTPQPPPKPVQLQSAAYIKVPPEDPTKEISGTRSEHRVKLSRIRQRIAQRLKDAQNTCAMLTTFNEIDMSHIMGFQKTFRETFTKKYGVKLGFMSAFIKASVYALQDQPVVNAVIIGNEIIYRDYIDVSIAVASPRGLLVPIIRNVEKMNYADIEKAIKVLGEKAKKEQITVEDMDGGTFTVSNGGVFGSLMGTPIINPPQSAILGMHGVFQRPVAINNQVVIRPMMYVALTYDHRLIDGREAVLFLRKIKAAVENPLIIIAGL